MQNMINGKHNIVSRNPEHFHSDEHSLSGVLESARDGLLASELLVKDRLGKARLKTAKDYHIKLREKNSKSGNRGKHSFVILPDTFGRIIDHIEQSAGYKKMAVIETLTMMYEQGVNFGKIKTDIGCDTALRYLRDAISALELDLGTWKKPSLKTLTFSRALLDEALRTNIDLSDRFHVV